MVLVSTEEKKKSKMLRKNGFFNQFSVHEQR